MTMATPNKISKRAEKTLDLIRKGRFYMAFGSRNPATIKELEAAGLIQVVARPVVIVAAYAPKNGYTPYSEEKFEEIK